MRKLACHDATRGLRDAKLPGSFCVLTRLAMPMNSQPHESWRNIGYRVTARAAMQNAQHALRLDAPIV